MEPIVEQAQSDKVFSRAVRRAKAARFSLVALAIGSSFGIFAVLSGAIIEAKASFYSALISSLGLAGFITAIISTCTLVVTTTGTLSALVLGWRGDRRQSQEFRLKIEQLELQIAEMREKSAKTMSGPPAN